MDGGRLSLGKPAETLRAGSLLRRYVWATIALGVFAGVAGGAALGVWAIARRTSTVYDRFVAHQDAATLSVFACPEGVDPEIEENYQELCADYDYADILDFLAGVPGVESAGRWTLALSWVAPADHPEAGSRELVPVAIDTGTLDAFGTPIMVEGRLPETSAASEVVVNEEAATRFGVGTGDQLLVTPYRVDEFDAAGEGTDPPSGQPGTVTIVGIVRTPGDLAGRLRDAGTSEDSSQVVAGPAWWEETGGDVARYGVGVLVEVAPGTPDDEVIQALHDRWPDRVMELEGGSQNSDPGQETVVDAIDLQALGLAFIAAVVALAGVVFAGQAVARQTRREWDDAVVLDALGMTRTGMVTAAGLRAAAIAAVAVVVGAIVAIAVTPFGPIGIGRAGEPDPGVMIDGMVLAIGLPVIALSVMVFTIVPVAAIRRRPHSDTTSTSSSRTLSALPATGVAGWAMTTSRRAGGFAIVSAVVGVGLACATGIAAWSVVSSYDDLVATPARYGEEWDALVGNVGSDQQELDTREKLDSIPGIRAVGIKSGTGLPSMPQATVVAAEPFIGEVAFGTVISGRAPMSATEVALGRTTLAAFGVGVGDTVQLQDPGDPNQEARSFTVVGEAVINDGLSAKPGDGALLTIEAFDELAPGNRSQTYAVWVDPGADRGATLDALRQAFPTTFIEKRVPRQIQNLGLVSRQPAVLALIIGVLAAAAMVHALVMSIRRGRRQIGILQTLGFRRSQVVAAVGWHASFIAGAALIVGVPLGVVIGRVVWAAVVDDLGVVSEPALPISAIVAVAALVLVVANLAALVPGLAAARTRPSVALRTE